MHLNDAVTAGVMAFGFMAVLAVVTALERVSTLGL